MNEWMLLVELKVVLVTLLTLTECTEQCSAETTYQPVQGIQQVMAQPAEHRDFHLALQGLERCLNLPPGPCRGLDVCRLRHTRCDLGQTSDCILLICGNQQHSTTERNIDVGSLCFQYLTIIATAYNCGCALVFGRNRRARSGVSHLLRQLWQGSHSTDTIHDYYHE